MTDISVNGLVKSFELGKNILDGLSFDIAEGERVGILGHNGCGKTTLFRILTGEIDYDEGAWGLFRRYPSTRTDGRPRTFSGTLTASFTP